MWYSLTIIISIYFLYKFCKSYRKWKTEEDKKDVELANSASWSLYRGVCKNTNCNNYEKLLPLKKVVYNLTDKYGEDDGTKLELICSSCGKETNKNIVLGWTVEQVNEKNVEELLKKLWRVSVNECYKIDNKEIKCH